MTRVSLIAITMATRLLDPGCAEVAHAKAKGFAALPQCAEATNGAREGETLADRIERLKTQLRLSVAEQKVRGR